MEESRVGLTGRTRYRTNWRGKLILQVEHRRYYCHDLNGTGYYDEGFTTHWRDARFGDLAVGVVSAPLGGQFGAAAGAVSA